MNYLIEINKNYSLECVNYSLQRKEIGNNFWRFQLKKGEIRKKKEEICVEHIANDNQSNIV